jgi:tripartite-type tricarboxylate transporter receptor subunit TctC
MINRAARNTLAAAALGLLASRASAQTGPIHYVVPLAPGGPNDSIARLMADEIGRTRGVSIVVDNKPGAGTVIGTDFVARAAPDGNTILQTAGSFTVNSAVKTLAYDPLADFAHICYVVETPQMLVVPASSPYHTIGELLDAARKNPGTLTLAANGPATAQHIEFELFKHALGVDITFVPFPGDAPTLTAILGGQTTAALFDYVTGAGQVADGKLRPLVVGVGKRLAELPDTPTLPEIGVQDLEWVGTLGVAAPAKTPPAVVAKLIDWFGSAVKKPEVQAKLKSFGLAKGVCGADYTAFLTKQLAQFRRGVKEANIKVE